MNIFRILITLALINTAMTAREFASCREWREGDSKCMPYRLELISVADIMSKDLSIKNDPITSKITTILIPRKIDNRVSLKNIISKYIAREERKYNDTEKIEEPKKPKSTISQLPTLIETPITKPIKKIVAKTDIKKSVVAPPKKVTPKITKADVNISIPKSTKKPIKKPTKKQATKVSPADMAVALPIKKSTKTSKADMAAALPAKKSPKKKVKISKADMATALPALATKVYKKRQIDKGKYAQYTITSGDSILSLAKKYSVESKKIYEINDINRSSIIKIGQKLYLPILQKRLDTIRTGDYIVESGDSILGIAKQFKVKVALLRKYNHFRKKSSIRIGQKIIIPLPHKIAQLKAQERAKKRKMLATKRGRARLAKIALIKVREENRRNKKLKFNKKLSVVATAYTSHHSQTDGSPFLAAWSNRIRPGMKIIAVSRDLIWKYGITNGKKVRISGLKGIYTVRDKMNKKWRRKIDIYMGTNRRKALRWGRKRVMLYY